MWHFYSILLHEQHRHLSETLYILQLWLYSFFIALWLYYEITDNAGKYWRVLGNNYYLSTKMYVKTWKLIYDKALLKEITCFRESIANFFSLH
jgi:hypothetical protein